MRVAITGSSGLVGSELRTWFEARGDTVTPVTRNRQRALRGEGAYWNPDVLEMDESAFEGHDVVIHLAGESIFSVWTRKRRARIRQSRVDGTHLLASGLAALQHPPRLLISASAIGFYGDRPNDEVLTEGAPPGDGFMADVVRSWEDANNPAADAGIRTAQLRFGLVMAREGGIVGTMMPLFRFGLGGVAGPGDQVWPWIALSEIPYVVQHVIDTESLAGPVNATSPNPVTAAAFSRALGRVMGRPVLLHAPKAIVALAPGGMGHELIIASANVAPGRLLDSGYVFRFADLEQTLRTVLRTPA